jgi:hypothetical protein
LAEQVRAMHVTGSRGNLIVLGIRQLSSESCPCHVQLAEQMRAAEGNKAREATEGLSKGLLSTALSGIKAVSLSLAVNKCDLGIYCYTQPEYFNRVSTLQVLHLYLLPAQAALEAGC